MSEAMEELWAIRQEINEELEELPREERRLYYQRAQEDYRRLRDQIEAKERAELQTA